jgi:site-specific recombinase XerD
MQQGEQEHGKAIFSLSYDQLAEARSAFERLSEHNVSLTAVVDHWIKFQPPMEVQKTFSELEKEFIVSRKNIGCKEQTLWQCRSYTKVVCEEVGSSKAARISQAEIEDWLSESAGAPRTRKNYLVKLVTLFEWARDRNYVVVNPAERITKPLLDDRPPGILSPDQAAKLLRKPQQMIRNSFHC